MSYDVYNVFIIRTYLLSRQWQTDSRVSDDCEHTEIYAMTVGFLITRQAEPCHTEDMLYVKQSSQNDRQIGPIVCFGG